LSSPRPWGPFGLTCAAIGITLCLLKLTGRWPFPSLLFPASSQPAEKPAPEISGTAQPPRFSRTAIVGACWAPFVFTLLVLLANKVSTPGYQGSAWWEQLLAIMLGGLGVTAPFGSTILGWIAVAQIRRSAGKLYGLGLAVFDGLLFPLLALDVAIWLTVGNIWGHNPPQYGTWLGKFLVEHDYLPLLLLPVLCAVVDWFIIRAVWRAVNKQTTGGATNIPPVNAPAKKGWWPIAVTVGVHTVLLLVLTVVLLFVVPRFVDTFKDLGAQLPMLTQLIIGIARIAQMGGFLLVPVVIALDVLLSWLAQRIGGRKLFIVWAVLGTLGLAATTAVITGAMFLPMSKMVERISAATPPQEQATAATFGPVIERTLLAVEEGEESKGLNLDRDRLVDFPANFSQMETQARETWLRGSKVNLFFKFPKELQSWEMVGNHLNWSIVQPKYLDPVVEGDLWTQLSAKDLMHNFCQPREVIMAQADKLMSALALNWLNPPITIAFNTKDNAGLMQITGFTEHPRGVKLRYKLVQGGATNAAAIAKPAPDDFKRTFGPVIEREVVEAIDFDSGKVANSLPESVTKSPDIAMNVLNAVSWMEREGMDAISEPSGDLKGVGMKARAVDKVAWDHLSPAEIVATLAIITRETWQDLDPRDKTDAERKTPATWVFETREGGKGILQVLEQTKAGVNVRYKLVQGGATNAAAAAAAAVAKPAAPLVFGPVTNGLQAAAEVTPDDPFQVHFHVRNVSKDTFTIVSLNYRQDDECILKDEQGKPVEVERGFDLSYTFTKREMLMPGKTVVLASGGLSFLPGGARWNHPTFHAKAKPGRYTLRFRVALDGNEPLDWNGTLETAPVTIEVKESGVALQNYLERTLTDLQESKVKQAALPSKPGLTDEERKAEAKELEAQLKADEEEAARLRELVQKSATNAAAGAKPAPVFHGASFVLPLRQAPAPAEAAPVPVPVVVRSFPALVPIGGILLLLVGGIAVIVLAVRKSKLGAGRTLAVGCGVIMLGFVLVLLLFAVISMGRTIQAAATRWSVQHARLQSARSTPPVAPGLAFGPVMERVVPNGDKCLNLLTGQLLPLPGLMTLAPDVRRAQADVYWPSGENDTRVLWILDCRVLDLDPAAWSNLSAAALEEKFHQLADSRRSSPGQNETRLPPGLYGFSGYRKTGLIQVIDDTNNYGGVKVRYKLVLGGATNAATVAKPAPADDKLSFGPVTEHEFNQNNQLLDLDNGDFLLPPPEIKPAPGNGIKWSQVYTWTDVLRVPDAANGVLRPEWILPDFVAWKNALREWEEKSGGDLLYGQELVGDGYEKVTLMLAGGLVIERLDPDGRFTWDYLPDNLMERFAILAARYPHSTINETIEYKNIDYRPGLFLFKTREGSRGLLQIILDKNKIGQGFKVRSKLVQGGTTNTVAAGKINEN